MLSLLLMQLAMPALPASPPSRTAVVPGSEDYVRASELIYSQSGTVNERERLLDRVEQRMAALPDPAARDYWLARVDLLHAVHFNQMDDSRSAGVAIERGFERIRRALDTAGEFSDGLRVLADLHAQMMLSSGLFYMVRHGDEARDAAQRALELDPENVEARISVAGYYLNAPRIAGGDPAAGQRVLEAGLAAPGLRDYQRFLLNGFLADAAIRQDQPAAAAGYIAEAARIYPRSPWLARLRRQRSELD